MKFSIALGLLLSSLVVLASPTPSAEMVERSIGAVSPREANAELHFPEDAAARKLGRRDIISNGELLKRGLTPSRPRKLYTPEVKKDIIDKRLANAPPSAGVGSATGYTLRGCGTSYNPSADFRLTTLTFTDLQDLADKCAAQQDAQATGTVRNFYIVNRSTDNCYTGITSTNLAACTPAADAGYYTPA